MLHKHRILPGHMGGTYDPKNVIELSVADHAKAHKELFEKYGNEYDRIAWLGLEGLIGKEEIISLSTKEGLKRWWESLSEIERLNWKKNCAKRPIGYRYPRGYKLSTETRLKQSKSRLGKKRKPFSEEHKRKLSAMNKDYQKGEKNVMKNPMIREKQKLACLGRKRTYREDGSWFWSK